MNDFELCGVESSSDSPKRTRQCPLGRLFLRSPNTSSETGIPHPHEVPARLTDHRVENRREDRFYKRPAVPDGFEERIQAFWQGAPLAEKNGMQLHFGALLDAADARGSTEPVELTAGVTGLPAAACSVE